MRMCQSKTPHLATFEMALLRRFKLVLTDCIAVVLSGQAGSRLTEQLAMPVSADTLLRRAEEKSPTPPTPRILGVDDFGATRSYRCSRKDSRKEDLTWSSASSALPG
jgi:hypothetical protein